MKPSAAQVRRHLGKRVDRRDTQDGAQPCTAVSSRQARVRTEIMTYEANATNAPSTAVTMTIPIAILMGQAYDRPEDRA